MAGKTNSSVDPSEDADQILFFSVVGGLCPLIPVPCLDTVFLKVTRRLMAAAQLRKIGLQPTLGQVSQLAREAPLTPPELAMKAAYYGMCCCTLEFLFKKVCFFLTIKDCVDNASEMLHEGWLIAYAAKAGYVSQQALGDKTQIYRISEAILKTCDQADMTVVKKALKTVFGENSSDLKESANTISGALRLQGISSGCMSKPNDSSVEEALDSVEREQRAELRGVTGQLAQILRQHRPYFGNLEQVFETKYQELNSRNALPPAMCPLLPC